MLCSFTLSLTVWNRMNLICPQQQNLSDVWLKSEKSSVQQKQIPSSNTSQISGVLEHAPAVPAQQDSHRCGYKREQQKNFKHTLYRVKMRIGMSIWPSHPCSLDISKYLTVLQKIAQFCTASTNNIKYFSYIFSSERGTMLARVDMSRLIWSTRSLRPFWCWSRVANFFCDFGRVFHWNKPQRAATTLSQIAWELLRAAWQWWFHWNDHGIMSCNQWLRDHTCC